MTQTNTAGKHPLGLTSQEAKERARAGNTNDSVKPPSKSIKQIVFSNIFTYFNFVFLLIAIILSLVHSFRDLTFLPIIVANTCIGIFQEIRSKIVLDRLLLLNSPTARVLRDGELLRVNPEQLVQDDVVLFKAGDQIVADAVVIKGEISANEALLTGEADEIRKTKDSELLSGSFVVSGQCYAKLTKVGAESYINQLTLEAKQTKKKEQSEIIRSLNLIVKIAGVAIIPIGIILFAQSYFGKSLDIKSSVQAMVASIIGMIPEGLYLLASVSLALSAMRLARRKILLHDMKSIETLARVDTLCVDKTGTITDNNMKVQDTEILDSKLSKDELFGLMSDFAFAQDADNITMSAIKAHFSKPTGVKIGKAQAFSSEFKYSGAEIDGQNYVLGAPEFVLQKDFEKYREAIEEHSRKSQRVLVLCKYEGELTGKALRGKIKAVALILLVNSIRENAAETFSYFAKQGVDIKVISGDSPLTVSEVAKTAKIKGADKYIDASTLKTDEAIDAALESYTVFGRVTPEQKRKFVKSLQKHGHTVAMTGDGVNDVLALRDADCSVAMASGSDAASQAAQVVLLESDFSCMPDVVLEGRRVVNNLERSGSLFLVKNVFSLLTSVLAICFAVTYPLMPSQVSLISMFTIGIPGFLLSQLPNKDIIRGNFVENILKHAIPAGLSDAFMIATMVVCGTILGLQTTDISTATTLVIAVVGFVYIYTIIRPLDNLRALILFGCILGLVLCTAFLPTLFSMARMEWRGWVLAVVMSLICPFVLRAINFVVSKLWEFIRSIHLNKTEKIRG
jgi:cation-transporting ATPase E